MTSEIRFLPRPALDDLLATLRSAGYRCVGPQVREGAIVFDTLQHASDLPHGWHDHQAPASYRLERSEQERVFAWANGPQALKPLTFASRENLWRAERDAEGNLHFAPILPQTEPIAFIGARACDLAALALQDQHFLEGAYPDPYYAARRDKLFVVAVDCAHPAETCFCVSTGDGPQANAGFDLALQELDEGFLLRAGSERGKTTLAQLKLDPASETQRRTAAHEIEKAAQAQHRTLPSRNLKEALFAKLEHPRWDEVATRCLSCGNCTSVCPTCFCHAEAEEPTLGGGESEHVRLWDSCFTQGHSYIAGYVARPSTKLRFRQWLTHKLGSWHDQYGRSGCVGCGRCITWCPVGIDITEEAQAIYQGGST